MEAKRLPPCPEKGRKDPIQRSTSQEPLGGGGGGGTWRMKSAGEGGPRRKPAPEKKVGFEENSQPAANKAAPDSSFKRGRLSGFRF